ncbi:TonB-dependent receptor domain-containing protein [Xenorhabdus szentirmaii]|uniref:TonB-dependent receptor n=1 Tax=Xenorhabdus szentirmaii TaxID=290112 RepID=A0AAW3YSK8_9GAMM|nr:MULTISPECIES: TonB-dependent receptor [unclassified Xenorhabdus]MBD2791709.1 TonB-dependent receptor [Xenorhabdus sp. CUL]MBD2800296.1 TonB-dependent receptor [Xenorhabdus sp. M]MBD2824613.1 TonB-dependent receptor [Xenorhabdus sp. 5]
MKIVAKIAGASAVLIGLQGIAYAENTNDDKKEKVMRFSSLKVSGAQDNNSPQIEAMEKPGAYSSVGDDNKLQSIDSVLRTLPGTYTQMDASQGVGAVSVNIRGLSGFGRVNMMVDGVSQSFYGIAPNEFGHAQMPYNQFGAIIDPNFIIRTDINRGQADGSDSVNTLAGSVNFRTIGVEDVIFEGNNFGVRTKASYGTNGLGKNGMVAVAGKIQAFSPEGSIGAMLAVSGYSVDAHYKNGMGINSEEFGTDETFKQKPNSQLTKLNIKPNDFHELELSGRYYHNKFTKRHIDNSDYYLKYHYTPFSELVDTKILLSSSKGTQRTLSEMSGLGKAESHNKSHAIDIKNTSRFNYGDTDFSFTLGSKLMQTEYKKKTGIDLGPDETSTEDSNVFSPSGKQDIASIYSDFKIEHGIYTVNLGLNYLDYSLKGYKPACSNNDPCFPEGETQVSSKGRGFNPSILLSAEIIPEFQPFVSYKHSMRAPNIQEMFYFGGESSSVNPFLKRETTDTYEIGFNSYRPNLIVDGDAFRLKATLFHTKIKDYINGERIMFCRKGDKEVCQIDESLTKEEKNALDATFNTYIYKNNVTPVTTKGYEISANYDAGVFYSSLAYSKQKTEQPTSQLATVMGASSSSRLPSSYLTLNTGIRLLDENMRVGAIMKYTGQSYHQDYENDTDWDIKEKMVKDDKIPTIVDLYADYKINKHIFVKFSVQNLANKNYADALNRMNSSINVTSGDTISQTARGRTYVMGAEVRF